MSGRGVTALERRLQADAVEVLGVDRRGGQAVWRDEHTLVVSGCEQVGSQQLTLLKSLHPRAHVVICSEGSVASKSGFVVLVTLLPSTQLAFSREMMEMVLVVGLYVSTMWCLVV